MAFVIKDRVRETTATTGTGTVTLAGAVSGYQAFSAIGNGNTTYYCIAGQGTNEWEVGIGTYTSAGTTLSRTTVLSSSNSGSLVPFSAGTKDVFVTQPASRAVFQDDLLDASTGNNFNAASYNGGQLAGFRNKLINGAMEVAQRGTSIVQNTGIQASYTLDRFARSALSTGQLIVTQELDGPASDLTLPYSYRGTVTLADAVIAASDFWVVFQPIEGYTARDLVGKTFTVSFWVRSSKTGVHCLTLNNNTFFSGPDRSYIAEYTINAANTWEYKQITITGGLITAGTWNWTNGLGLLLGWTLYCGTTRQTTAGSWQTGSFAATSSQVNVLDTIGNIFAITGVQVEVGNVATPFEHRPFGTELALCQRYYEKSFSYATAPAQNTGTSLGAAYATGQVTNQAFSSQVVFAVAKRTAPTITTYAPDAATANWSTNTTTPTSATTNIGESGFAVTGSTAVTAGNGYSIHWQAVAEILN